MRPIAFIVLTSCMSLLTGRLLAGNQPAAEDELTRIKREYGDVLGLQGTSKGEILAIARILRATNIYAQTGRASLLRQPVRYYAAALA